jgi:hypothetical protein
MTVLDELSGDDASDIASAPGDQQLHERSPTLADDS